MKQLSTILFWIAAAISVFCFVEALLFLGSGILLGSLGGEGMIYSVGPALRHLFLFPSLLMAYLPIAAVTGLFTFFGNDYKKKGDHTRAILCFSVGIALALLLSGSLTVLHF